jgi:LmbE family N-acetylglucosaminyl deacetylase
VNTQCSVTFAEFGLSGKVVVVAPHPDDEVFAVGGLMAMLSRARCEVEVVAVTDGEASHAASSRVTPAEIRLIRLEETRAAYQHLGISPAHHRLRLPDSAICTQSDHLRRELRPRLSGASSVLAPIETDGHPDHDVVGRITHELTSSTGLQLWKYAVWAQLHPERISHGTPFAVRLPHDIVERKQRAVATYRSQFVALGPCPEDGPVLPPGFGDHFTGSREFLWPAD